MGIVNKGCSCIMWFMAISIAGTVFGCAKSCAQRATMPSSRFNENIPGQTARFVKETNEGYRSASTSTSAAVPTGKFTINLKARGSCDKSFIFDVRGRDENNILKMGVTEKGAPLTTLDGPVRFNVVFWNSGNPNKGGLKFQLGFYPEKGCYTDKADPTLKTLYISQGEQTFINYISSKGSFAFTQERPRVRNSTILNSYELSMPEQTVKASEELINLHTQTAKPIEQKPLISPTHNNYQGR